MKTLSWIVGMWLTTAVFASVERRGIGATAPAGLSRPSNKKAIGAKGSASKTTSTAAAAVQPRQQQRGRCRIIGRYLVSSTRDHSQLLWWILFERLAVSQRYPVGIILPAFDSVCGSSAGRAGYLLCDAATVDIARLDVFDHGEWIAEQLDQQSHCWKRTANGTLFRHDVRYGYLCRTDFAW